MLEEHIASQEKLVDPRLNVPRKQLWKRYHDLGCVAALVQHWLKSFQVLHDDLIHALLEQHALLTCSKNLPEMT